VSVDKKCNLKVVFVVKFLNLKKKPGGVSEEWYFYC
jgi:hypothetical protein